MQLCIQNINEFMKKAKSGISYKNYLSILQILECL